MYERPRVNVKVERGSTPTFTCDLPYVVSSLFTRVKITRQWNQPKTIFPSLYSPTWLYLYYFIFANTSGAMSYMHSHLFYILCYKTETHLNKP